MHARQARSWQVHAGVPRLRVIVKALLIGVVGFAAGALVMVYYHRIGV